MGRRGARMRKPTTQPMGEAKMRLHGRAVVRIGTAASLALLVGGIAPVAAQKSGGTLRVYNTSQPPSASIHEESTIATNMPFMAVFNNLVRFDAMKPRGGFDTIVPELAESWAWDDAGTKLTFKLRSGVNWHDGKPFTGKDVQCTGIVSTAPTPSICGAIRARSGTRTSKRSRSAATTR
jgi:ABC-type transport system substrate-binding protein